MSQTYTLDEAADKLNLSVEEFKRRLRGEWARKVHVVPGRQHAAFPGRRD